MKKAFSQQERDAFAKAVSAVEGIVYSAEDDRYFADLLKQNHAPEVLVASALARALAKP